MKISSLQRFKYLLFFLMFFANINYAATYSTPPDNSNTNGDDNASIDRDDIDTENAVVDTSVGQTNSTLGTSQ